MVVIADTSPLNYLILMRNIQTTGTLGVLDAAAEMGLLELPRALEARLRTNFHVSQSIVQRLLDGDLRRKRARK